MRIALTLTLLLASCQTATLTVPTAWTAPEAVGELARRLSGHLSSEPQSLREPSYFAVDLRSARIWPERTDGVWLYVEQALAARPEAPYRQRVYHVTGDAGFDGRWTSEVYALDSPEDFVGAWAPDRTDFEGMTPAQLVLRDGCAIHLAYDADADSFHGSTHYDACGSDLNGARYATSSVRIGDGHLFSWDRGWSSPDQQVWGAVDGPYLFERVR